MILIDTNKVSSKELFSFPLSETVVKMIIVLSKHFLNNPNFNFPSKHGYKNDACVELNYKDEKEDLKILFILHIYQGDVDKNKYSIHIRFHDNNEHLVRLCMNGANHKNKNKEIIKGSHIHIYDENDLSHAHNLKEFPIFNSKDDLHDSLKHFEKFVNIKIPQNTKPQITK